MAAREVRGEKWPANLEWSSKFQHWLPLCPHHRCLLPLLEGVCHRMLLEVRWECGVNMKSHGIPCLSRMYVLHCIIYLLYMVFFTYMYYQCCWWLVGHQSRFDNLVLMMVFVDVFWWFYMGGSAARQFPKGNLRWCQESKNQFEENVGRVNVANLCKFVVLAKF